MSIGIKERVESTQKTAPPSNSFSTLLDLTRRGWKTAEKVLRPLEPLEWYMDNKIIYDRKNAYVRDFNVGEYERKAYGNVAFVLPPQAGHSPPIASFGPGQSIVEVGLEEGYAMFSADWRPAQIWHRNQGIDHFIKKTDEMVDTIRKKTGKDKITLIGLCQGGWQAAIYTALHPEKIEALVLAGSPIDTNTGEGQVEQYAAITKMETYERMIEVNGGVMPGFYMLTAFKMLDPVKLIYEAIKVKFQHIDEPEASDFWLRQDMFDSWFDYGTQNVPGALYLEAVKKIFKENQLFNGVMEVLGQRVDLSKITVPITFITGLKDHITKKKQLTNAEKVVGTTDIEEYETEGGHIGVFQAHSSMPKWRVALRRLKSRIAARNNILAGPDAQETVNSLRGEGDNPLGKYRVEKEERIEDKVRYIAHVIMRDNPDENDAISSGETIFSETSPVRV